MIIPMGFFVSNDLSGSVIGNTFSSIVASGTGNAYGIQAGVGLFGGVLNRAGFGFSAMIINPEGISGNTFNVSALGTGTAYGLGYDNFTPNQLAKLPNGTGIGGVDSSNWTTFKTKNTFVGVTDVNKVTILPSS